jgi:hypothetical protein
MSMSSCVFIATPCFGGLVTQGYMQSIINCIGSAGANGISLTLSMIGNDALITRCRNTLVQQFMSYQEATHLLFVDSDISFPPDAIMSLLSADRDVIGGLYPLKDRYWDEVTDIRIAAGEAPEMASLRYVGECAAMHEAEPGTALIRAAWVGTGFLLIRRQVIEKMIAAYPDMTYSRIDAARNGKGSAHENDRAWALFDCMIDPGTGTYLSEDFAFCQRWRQIGGEVWLDTSLILTHTGASGFTGNPFFRVGAAFASSAPQAVAKQHDALQ